MSHKFKTLRVTSERIGSARWILRIRFVFRNNTKRIITMDDIHTRRYFNYTPVGAPLTVGYAGEVFLLQDNSLFKDRRSYSLDPGNGYEMVLVLEVARYKTASVASKRVEEPGAILSVFGILVDYYFFVESGDIRRKTVPSDCVYWFECVSRDSDADIYAIDQSSLASFMARQTNYHSNVGKSTLLNMPRILDNHLSFRPIPRP